VDRIGFAAGEVAGPDYTVRIGREGTFGVLPSETATPLAMVLNELLLNAVEHGFVPGDEGSVTMTVHRFRKQLHVTVADTGKGLPEGFRLEGSERLGLQIVRTLITGELRGTLELRDRSGGGTEAVLVVPLTRK
jgi:two-component sensor histidine kinase